MSWKTSEERRAYDRSSRGRLLSRARDKRRAVKQAERLRKYRQTYRGQLAQRNANLIRDFGITLAQWFCIFLLQRNRCAACGSSDPGNKKQQWHTDHDHNKKIGDFGFVRGILCGPCNLALSHLHDDINRTIAICDYMRRWDV